MNTVQTTFRHALMGALSLGLVAVAPAQSWGNGTLFAGSDTAPGDLLGSAVDLCRDQLIIGAFGHDHAGIQTTGGAWIRERQLSGGWAETAKLIPADVATQDQFGYAVAISPGRALVGSRFDDDLGSSSGSAYVFERQADGTWLEVAKLLASDGAAGHEFGTSVDIDGDYAVVGAPDWMTGFVSSGAAYVFERQSNGDWIEVAKLLQNDLQNGDDFGLTVSISGTRVAAGAPLDDDNGPASGSAYVFERQPDGTWPQVDKLIASDGERSDFFGYSVAISNDRVVAGAWLDDDLGSGSGSAYVYERQSDGTWAETFKLLPPNQWSGGHFGQAVALEGDVALIGCIHDRVNNQGNAGSATMFVRKTDGTWADAGTLFHPVPGANDNFGHDVAIAEDGAIVGASQDDSFGAEAGAAHLYYTYGGYGLPVFQGTGTAGCSGPHSLGTNGPATLGNLAFAFTDVNAPANGLGALLLGDVGNPLGADTLGLGFLMHVDINASSLFFSVGMTADANGDGTGALPIPNDPNLRGLVLNAQSVWFWPNCATLPFGGSSSNLATFAIVNQ